MHPYYRKASVQQGRLTTANEWIKKKKKRERNTHIFQRGHISSGFTHLLHSLMCVWSHFSHVWLFVTQWTIAHQAPLPMGFSWQEYWSGLPFPSPCDLSNPWIELHLLSLLHWQAGSLPIGSLPIWGLPGNTWQAPDSLVAWVKVIHWDFARK